MKVITLLNFFLILTQSSAQTEQMVSCSSKKCVDNTLPSPVTALVSEDSLYGVRCCSDAEISGFFPATKCPNLWVASRDGNGDCVREVTYSDAVAVCDAHGARLCTAQENLADCTRPAKCSLNNNKVWAVNGEDIPSNPSNPGTPGTTDTAVISCSSKKCVKFLPSGDSETGIVTQDSTYGLRCCSETPLEHFMPATTNCPNLWVSSRTTDTDCVRAATYSDAVAVCEAHGARLCTAQENLEDCTRPAKCGLNDNKVWTSTPTSDI